MSFRIEKEGLKEKFEIKYFHRAGSPSRLEYSRPQNFNTCGGRFWLINGQGLHNIQNVNT